MTHHLRLPKNKDGRDFVVADIHGCYDTVVAALEAARFNYQHDRLISVGDLADRGPASFDVVRRFMQEKNFFAVRGNHEQMCIDAVMIGTDNPIRHFLVNGGKWFFDLTEDQQVDVVQYFNSLPLAITIETNYGDVGIVHAQPDQDATWPRFVDSLEHDHHSQNIALWSRGMIQRYEKDHEPVRIDGARMVICGHTVVNEPTTIGNVTFIDCGAFLGRDLIFTQVQP